MTVSREEFERRMAENLKRAIESTAPPVPLSKRKPRIVKNLEGVREVRPSSLDTPILTRDQEITENEREIELEETRNQLKEARAGGIRWSTRLKGWLGAGIGAGILGIAVAYLKGCA